MRGEDTWSIHVVVDVDGTFDGLGITITTTKGSGALGGVRRGNTTLNKQINKRKFDFGSI